MIKREWVGSTKEKPKTTRNEGWNADNSIGENENEVTPLPLNATAMQRL